MLGAFIASFTVVLFGDATVTGRQLRAWCYAETRTQEIATCHEYRMP